MYKTGDLMSNYEKSIIIGDAVLDCVPAVSTLSNAAEALYKLAHKVDTQNPVTPGWKTSIKIHVLSKSYTSCFIGAIPILGNLCKLVELVYKCIYGFDDHLINAFASNNEEMIRLSLGNDLDDKIFTKIFNSQKNWSKESLRTTLKACMLLRDTSPISDARYAFKITHILAYWVDHYGVPLTNDHMRLLATSYFSISNFKQILNGAPIQDRKVLFYSLKNLLNLDKASDFEIGPLITLAVYYEDEDFANSLIDKYGSKLNPFQKVKILEQSRDYSTSTTDRNRLRDILLNRWKKDLQEEAARLQPRYDENCSSTLRSTLEMILASS
jgi:hypothetical protein